MNMNIKVNENENGHDNGHGHRHGQTSNMDTDTDMNTNTCHGHDALVSHHQAGFEISFGSNFISRLPYNQPPDSAQHCSHTVWCSLLPYSIAMLPTISSVGIIQQSWIPC